MQSFCLLFVLFLKFTITKGIAEAVSSHTKHDLSLKAWMTGNIAPTTLSEDTYDKLTRNGFTTIDHLKEVTVEEMNAYLKEMAIQISDRSPLIRAVENLGNKQRLIDPTEIELCKSMETKLKEFEDTIREESLKQQNVIKQADEIEAEIFNAFAQIFDNLNERKVCLSAELDRIKHENLALFKSRIDEYTKTLETLQHIKKESDVKMNSIIEVDELAKRMQQIRKNEQRMIQLIDEAKETNQCGAECNINSDFHTSTMLEAIGQFGSIWSRNSKNDETKQWKLSPRNQCTSILFGFCIMVVLYIQIKETLSRFVLILVFITFLVQTLFFSDLKL